ncbi:MAG: pyrimidine-nucleoside phosphorylase, partial [Sarcina sp.]
FVKTQGGDISVIEDTSKLPKAKYVLPVKSEQEGLVSKINAENIGLVAMELGAGRATKESIIDLAVGIVLTKKRGNKVEKGDIIAYVHANDLEKGEKAVKDIINNYTIGNSVKEIPLIYDIVR